MNVDFAGKKILTISKPAGRPAAALSDIDIVEAAYGEDDPLKKEIDSFAAAVRSGEEQVREDVRDMVDAALGGRVPPPVQFATARVDGEASEGDGGE